MSIIKVEDLTKLYRLYDKPTDRLKESINPFGKKYHKDFYALDNVSFDIKRGENVGIIGKNGSGKSTLLKIITGILTPTSGTVQVNGKISAILELGAGFNPEYTGIENIYLNGMIMGYSREQMAGKIEDILSFADIGRFIEQPVKTYSSGMYARLAFAVAINIEPDILIVDEALAVGDMGFQHKCMNKMKEMIERGVSILFVSHDPAAIKSLCNRCIYLVEGKVQAVGNATEVTDMYLRDIRKKIYTVESDVIQGINTATQTSLDMSNDILCKAIEGNKKGTDENFIIDRSFEEKIKSERYGTKGALIRYVGMINEKGEIADHFEFNEKMKFVIHVECFKDIDKLNCCILIRNKNGIDITGTTTFEEKFSFPFLKKNDKVVITFECPNLLKHDMTYSVGVTINNTESVENQVILDHIDLAYTFKSTYNPQRPVWYSYYQDFTIDYRMVD